MGELEEYGGLGTSVLECAPVLEELATVCYVTAIGLMTQVGVQKRVIRGYAPDHLKQAILPKAVTAQVNSRSA